LNSDLTPMEILLGIKHPQRPQPVQIILSTIRSMILELIKTSLVPRLVNLQLSLLPEENCTPLLRNQREDTLSIIKSLISELMRTFPSLIKILTRQKSQLERS